MLWKAQRCFSTAIFLLAFMLPTGSLAGAIPSNSFLEFAFNGIGFATGCDPADPNGAFCTPSSGTPTGLLDAPAWTFTTPNDASVLTVTDAFEAGDVFMVTDFNSILGLTSQPSGSADCGDDPFPCLADPNMSHGSFTLAAGSHSIRIYSLTAGSGSGYLGIDAIPEPAMVWFLVAGGLIALAGVRYGRQSR